MQAWRQRFFDWEAVDRRRESLRRHLELSLDCDADRRLLLAIFDRGQFEAGRSLYRATMRDAATACGLSLGGLAKARDRLVANELIRYGRGVFLASWSRVWALEPIPDPAAELAANPAEGGDLFARVRARSRPPKNQEEEYLNTPQPKNPSSQANPEEETFVRLLAQRRAAAESRERSIEPAAIGAAIGGVGVDFEREVQRQHLARVDDLAGRILQTLARVEDRHGVDRRERLRPATAAEIAEGICQSPDADIGLELRRVLASLTRKDAFERSPAAWFVRCSQRRGWIRAGPPGRPLSGRKSGRKSGHSGRAPREAS